MRVPDSYGADIPIPIKVEKRIFVEVSGSGNFSLAQLYIESVGVLKIFDFHCITIAKHEKRRKSLNSKTRFLRRLSSRDKFCVHGSRSSVGSAGRAAPSEIARWKSAEESSLSLH